MGGPLFLSPPQWGGGVWRVSHARALTPCCPSRQLVLRAVGQCSPRGRVTPHICPRGLNTTEPPLPTPGHTELGLSPAHSTAHLTTTPRRQQHIQTARQRKHGQAWTCRAGGCETTSVAPGCDTHGAHSYLPSLSPCHVFSRACPVEAMSEVECGVGGQHGTGHRGTGGRDMTSS